MKHFGCTHDFAASPHRRTTRVGHSTHVEPPVSDAREEHVDYVLRITSVNPMFCSGAKRCNSSSAKHVCFCTPQLPVRRALPFNIHIYVIHGTKQSLGVFVVIFRHLVKQTFFQIVLRLASCLSLCTDMGTDNAASLKKTRPRTREPLSSSSVN